MACRLKDWPMCSIATTLVAASSRSPIIYSSTPPRHVASILQRSTGLETNLRASDNQLTRKFNEFFRRFRSKAGHPATTYAHAFRRLKIRMLLRSFFMERLVFDIVEIHSINGASTRPENVLGFCTRALVPTRQAANGIKLSWNPSIHSIVKNKRIISPALLRFSGYRSIFRSGLFSANLRCLNWHRKFFVMMPCQVDICVAQTHIVDVALDPY